MDSGLLESGAADAHDARGWLRDCWKEGLLTLMMLGALLGRGAADAHDARGWLEMQQNGMADAAGGWLRDCWKVGC